MERTTPDEPITSPEERDPLALLAQPLDPSRVRMRESGRGGVPYLEGYDLIATANRIFGFGGWAYRIDECRPTSTAQGALMYVATCTVEALGVRRTDVGFGIVELPSRGNNAGIDTPQAHETAFKGAATDALKRALRSFGAQFGNDLYDKEGPARGNASREAPRGRGSDSGRRNEGPKNGTGKVTNVGELLTWARAEHGLDRSAVLRVLNVSAPSEITDLRAAASAIVSESRKATE